MNSSLDHALIRSITDKCFTVLYGGYCHLGRFGGYDMQRLFGRYNFVFGYDGKSFLQTLVRLLCIAGRIDGLFREIKFHVSRVFHTLVHDDFISSRVSACSRPIRTIDRRSTTIGFVV